MANYGTSSNYFISSVHCSSICKHLTTSSQLIPAKKQPQTGSDCLTDIQSNQHQSVLLLEFRYGFIYID